MASSSVAALFLGVILALLCASSYARPGGPFHPCNTLSITYTISSSSVATAAVPHRAYRFVSIYRIITPFSSSSANAFDDRRPLLIRRPGLPRREVAEPAALGFSSLHERAKDILVVAVGLLFGVGCGALTAATMYLVWPLVANRNEVYGSDGEEGDYAVDSPKKAGYVKIPSAEPAPAKVGYEGN
ncbi:hypothetical protein C4D60_Mb04t22460 [Musa balbisiana]|uniref:Uncharacterized protein n=1 Tax=Musa balbisiana TaxID=52838 RepID=A0A4S8KDW5_MUSBA|nr:hypothetical protein C4D60_Mb04t22460 [Musa balbisiana]